MRSYLAFKGLSVEGDILASPSVRREWKYVVLNGETYPALIAPKSDLANGYGVFAAGWDKANDYSPRIFMVAPAPELLEDADEFMVLGEGGWRARAAIALGEYSKDEAAKAIIAAHYAGYPQVDDILRWAAIRVWEKPLIDEFINSLKEERNIEAITKHPNVTDDMLLQILNAEPDKGIWAAKSPYATEKVLLRCLEHELSELTLKALDNPNATEKVLSRALEICDQIDMTDQAHPAPDTRAARISELAAMTIASSPQATEDILLRCLENKHRGVRINAAENPNATDTVYARCLNDSDYAIAMIGARACKSEALMLKALSDPRPDVAGGAAKNPNATEEFLWQALAHPSPYVRSRAMENPNITSEMLEEGLNDPRWEVRVTADIVHNERNKREE